LATSKCPPGSSTAPSPRDPFGSTTRRTRSRFFFDLRFLPSERVSAGMKGTLRPSPDDFSCFAQRRTAFHHPTEPVLRRRGATNRALRATPWCEIPAERVCKRPSSRHCSRSHRNKRHKSCRGRGALSFPSSFRDVGSRPHRGCGRRCTYRGSAHGSDDHGKAGLEIHGQIP